VVQHPKVALAWTINGLETAIRDLGDGPAERRVRRQFHQLIAAMEHAAQTRIYAPVPEPRVRRAAVISSTRGPTLALRAR
jgi:hypothetical protein